jgi:hypothetical protein
MLKTHHAGSKATAMLSNILRTAVKLQRHGLWEWRLEWSKTSQNAVPVDLVEYLSTDPWKRPSGTLGKSFSHQRFAPRSTCASRMTIPSAFPVPQQQPLLPQHTPRLSISSRHVDPTRPGSPSSLCSQSNLCSHPCPRSPPSPPQPTSPPQTLTPPQRLSPLQTLPSSAGPSRLGSSCTAAAEPIDTSCSPSSPSSQPRL